MTGIMFATETLLLAGKYRLISRLFQGDPMAWTIVGVTGVIGIAGLVIKARISRSSLDK